MRAILLCILASLTAPLAFGQTMYLDQDGTWKALGSSEQDQYMLRIVNIKQLISDGKADDAREELEALWDDYPRLESQGIDSFIKAEVLYADGRFIKAARAYTAFLDAYPVGDLYDAGTERLYQIGYAFLQGHKKPVLWIFRARAYEDGVRIMEALGDRAGNAPIAHRALAAVASSYESRSMWRDAHMAWSNVYSRWPGGQQGRDALEGMGRTMLNAYNGARFEASSLASARGYYLQLQERFPEYAGSIHAAEILGGIDVELANKELEIGKYYRKTRSHTSAKLYFQRVIDTWPATPAAEEAAELMAQYAE